MNRKMGYRWNLRQVMAGHEMFATTDLVGPLAERGVVLSREQVFRLVTQPPQRLSLEILAALCDIFDCTPNDLIEIEVVNVAVRKAASEGSRGGEKTAGGPTGRRVAVRRPDLS